MRELFFEEETEGKWPVELLVTLGRSGQITLLDRDSYNELLTENLTDCNHRQQTTPPGILRAV